MATENTVGKLYRIDTNGSYHVMADNLLVPNGMGFVPILNTFILPTQIAVLSIALITIALLAILATTRYI